MTDGYIFYCPKCRRAYYYTGTDGYGETCECGEELQQGPQVR